MPTSYFPAGAGTYSLGSSIGSTDTTILLSSFLEPVSGTPYTMALLNTAIAYATIAPGTTSSEFISFTGITQNDNGSATLTGVTRGLAKKYPFTASATFKLPHSGQSLFILSDAPQVFNEYAALRNQNTFADVNEFTLLPTSSGGNAINPTQLITYAQALALATGTANINRIVVAGNGGETVTAGQLLYLLVSDGEWYKCDADTAATVDNIIMGIAQGAGSDGNPITNGILLFGLDSNQTGLSNNTTYYASNTAGSISSTPGTVEVTVGVARSTTSILFYPRFNQQLTEDQQDALAGASGGGSPSNLNRYETENDTSSGIDQSQTTQNGTKPTGEANSTTKYNKIAQSFVAGKTSITGAMLYKSADTGSFVGTVTVSLQADSASAPSGVALATVTLSNAAWVALNAGLFTALFSASYTATLGTTYWLVIETSTSDNSNHPNLGTNTAGGYTSGSVKFNNTTDGWTAVATIDLTFYILTTIANKLTRADATGRSFAQTWYGTDAGATDAYEINIPTFPGTLQKGDQFVFQAATANTGAATLNVNSTGAVAIRKNVSTALATGDILANQMITVEYDGTFFQILATAKSVTGLFYTNGTTTKDSSDASAVQNIAHGLGVIPRKIKITAIQEGGAVAQASAQAVTVYNGTTQSSISVTGGPNLFVAAASFNLNTNNTAVNITSGVVTFDATNIIITWTKANAPTGIYNLLWEAEV